MTDNAKYTPDAPLVCSVSGKYKLLISSVTPKFDRYEYLLVDAEGREYGAVSDKYYSRNQLLRCMVSIAVVKTKLVVSEVTICKKQDLLIPTTDEQNISSETYTSPEVKTVINDSNPDYGDKHQPDSPVVRPLSEDEIQNLEKQIEDNKSKRNASYICCGHEYRTIFDIRKHLFECHPEDYKKHLRKKLHRDIPTPVRGVGVKVHKKSSYKKRRKRNSDTGFTVYKGDYFRLIYTPMGNKR